VSDHYFSASPSSGLRTAPVRATVWGHALDLASASGVFARGRLDLGTSVLFRSVEPPATVWAVDVNERALQLTVENARRAGVADRVHACLPQDVDAQVRFDEIWSNPPIRIGKPALHELLLTWLVRLQPTGRAVLVVGRNLGADSLQDWLGSQEYSCKRLASAKGFRVLEVRPSPLPGAAGWTHAS
jgi:16S rRNA G1207 methylase RsmC